MRTFIRDDKGIEKPLAPLACSLQTKLGELIPQEGMHTVILYRRGEPKPIVLKLLPGESLFAHAWGRINEIAPSP